MASISRNSFDENKRVTEKIWQHGSAALDCDLNESAHVALHDRRRMLSCIIGHANARFDEGYKVEGHADDLKVTIKAGNAAFHMSANQAAMITLDTDVVLEGFGDWVAGGIERTDIVYLDIQESEYGPSEDSTIIEPLWGAETCRDMRLVVSFAIESGSSDPLAPPTTLPTAPAGHVYAELARVIKSADNNRVVESDIALTLADSRSGVASLEYPVYNYAHHHDNWTGNDALPLDNDTYDLYVQGVDDNRRTVRVLRFPYVHNLANKYLALHCEAWKSTDAKEAVVNIELTVPGGATYTGYPGLVINTDPTHQVIYLDPASAAATGGQMFDMAVALSVRGTNHTVTIRRISVLAGLGSFAVSGGTPGGGA